MVDTFAEALRGCAQGTVSVSDAQSVLRSRADFSFGTNPAWVDWHRPLDLQFVVPIRVQDVRAALNRFLSGTWAPRDLYLWAQFITLIGAYQFPNWDAVDDNYYNAVWDVIHDLSSPEIHGVATEESVRAQLNGLGHYPESE